MALKVLKLDDVVGKNAVFRLPHIIAFNRLEPRPRTLDFSRSLRAEVRDPLWMLTRQWQFGEFQGEDAASCVTARIAFHHEPIDRLAFREQQPFEFKGEAMPLETRVEREPIPLTVRTKSTGEIFSDVLFAVQWGKQFLRLLQAANLDNHYPDYIKKYPIRVWPPEVTGEERQIRDPEAEQFKVAVGSRIADGVAILLEVENGKHDAWVDAEAGVDAGALKTIAADFAAACRRKLKRIFNQPEDEKDTAWLKNRLEYQFTVAGQAMPSGPQTNLFAEQYQEGHLDWYSFDSVRDRTTVLDPEPDPVPVTEEVESFIPGNVRFKGQPQPRFWEMEESQTDFGKIETSTTGLLHMMLAEFALIYSNDWFMLPHPMIINTVCDVSGILVDDTFGRHTFIRPAARGPESAWQRWAMFRLTERQPSRSDVNRFYLAPAVSKVLESDPLERLNLLRDEMANMVWGVENIVPSQAGKGISGFETSQLSNAPPSPLTTTDENTKIRYVLGTTVPKNWIPFIAVHKEGSVSEIRLQRARMVGGDPPRGRLLREPGSPYFVEEEEGPRTGAYVERSWQRARWIGGATFIWIGRKKTAGRGEGWSQLVFDQIVDLQITKP